MGYTLGPFDTTRMKSTIKVSSTETGHIFGNITYDMSNKAKTSVLNLDEIHLDIMDYIQPGHCSDSDFRSMWAEFEWENKVAVSTNITNVREYLEHVAACTNTSILTSTPALAGVSDFLAANLYARSIFGEDALLNVSVERTDRKALRKKHGNADGRQSNGDDANEPEALITGYIRIRSKTQGIALSLGDRITATQRSLD